MLSDSLFERGNFVMRRQLSKVQFEAIEKLRTGALTILHRRNSRFVLANRARLCVSAGRRKDQAASDERRHCSEAHEDAADTAPNRRATSGFDMFMRRLSILRLVRAVNRQHDRTSSRLFRHVVLRR